MNDLTKIKKYYGEHMMHLCRDLFSTLLEQENLLFSLLDSNFAHSKFLYDDIIEENLTASFKNYIYSLVDVEKDKIEVIKTPKELLDEAGYILYECKSESDIQNFKKYYSKGEELCTFRGERLNSCHVFFAVKKNVDAIKRENFSNPTRQDEYGTSVISIQFTKGNINTLSIKNRYNHTVNNPDATFSNNLENIIPGLTRSFEKEYKLNINQTNNNFELENYVKADDGKYYRYNYEIDNVYYCPNNIIIDNFDVKKYAREKYLIVDYFRIDLVNKKIYLYNYKIRDSFIDGLKNIKKIEINKIEDTKLIKLTLDNDNIAYLELDKYNRITSYSNKSLTTIGDDFLYYNKVLNTLEISNVTTIGNRFLHNNRELTKLYLPEVTIILIEFLYMNNKLSEIYLPKLTTIEKSFLIQNKCLEKISLPNAITIGNLFLADNYILNEIELPKAEYIGKKFLNSNRSLKEINLPNAKVIDSLFISNNNILEKIYIPKVTIIKDYFLQDNKSLNEINLPNVEQIGDEFLRNNDSLTEINAPNLIEIGDKFLYRNRWINEINLPKVTMIGNDFLCDNDSLREINAPELTTIGDDFLFHNEYLRKLKLPKLTITGNSFLYLNEILEEVDLPNTKKIGIAFLFSNERLKKINLPNVEKISSCFLFENKILSELNIPLTTKIGEDFLHSNKKNKIKKKIIQLNRR